MTRNRWIALGVIAAVAVAAAGVWFVFLRSDAPERVSLEGALSAATSTTEAEPSGPDSSTSSAPPTTETVASAPATTAPAAEDVDGTWQIELTSDSFVGYRVREELSGIGAATAVGRTPDVQATLELAGTSVLALDVAADLTTLRSDSSQRDGQLRSRGLETNDFPMASFRLTEPIELGAIPTVGAPLSVTARGELTLHGVTRAVAVPVQAQRTDTQIVVVGSLPVFLPDYDIEAPTGLRVLSIDDNAEMEFQLFFARS